MHLHIELTANPQNFNISGKARCVNLGWNAPEGSGRNGIITHYIIQLQNDSEIYSYNLTTSNIVDNEIKCGETAVQTEDSWVIEHLKPNTTYNISMAAANIKGLGPYTNTIDFNTEEDGKYLSILYG